MEDLAISKDELRTLLQIISGLAVASDEEGYLDAVVEKIRVLVPFEKCTLLHERSGEPDIAQLVYESRGGSAVKLSAGRGRNGEAPGIRLYLKELRKIETLQNAFFWRRVDPRDGDDFELETEIGASQGIAGNWRAADGDSGTLICLQCADRHIEPLGGKHLFFINSIVFHLHGHFGRFNASLRSLRAPHSLTSKEKEVLLWVMQGKTSWEVGTILSMSERTVKFHLHNIYTKLNVVNRAQAVDMANRLRLV